MTAPCSGEPATVTPRPRRNSSSPSSRQNAEGPQHRVAVDAENRSQVAGGREPLTGPGFAGRDGPADLRRHLVVQGHAFGPVDLDLQHSAIHNSIMTTEVTDPVPAPTEVLIPEARQHQKSRYLWTGLVAALAALVLAALIGGAVILLSSSPTASGSRQAVVPAVAAPRASYVYFRPVLCAVPAYTPGAGSVAPASPPSCDAASELTGSNLGVTPLKQAPDGFTSNNVAPDSALADVPSTSPSADRAAASATVLLPALPGSDGFAAGQRLVLGPAEMTNTSVGSAHASKNRFGQWEVDYTMESGTASMRWDQVALGNFHQMLGIDFGGTVDSAPLIQPAQSSFSSFDGRGQITGSLTRTQAVALARALGSHEH